MDSVLGFLKGGKDQKKDVEILDSQNSNRGGGDHKQGKI